MIVLEKIKGTNSYATLIDLAVTSGTLQSQIDNKSDIGHTHDDRYYTEAEIDSLISSTSGIAPTNFLSLTDTPTTYSGYANYYVGVNSDGTALTFIPDSDGSQSGVTAIVSGTESLTVTYDTPFTDTYYALVLTLESTISGSPSNFPLMIGEKTTTGFTVLFSGDIDDDGYYLNWIATYGIINPTSCCICAVVEDTTPQLGGNLEVGSNLVVLDTSPYNDTIHGYDIGYSGNSSEVYVYDNSGGFACPLYMKSDGTWASCTAASGTSRMPCGALALEEEDGGIKKVLWEGIIKKNSWDWTPGAVIYVSTVEHGGLVDIQPDNGAWVQPIGFALSEKVIKFDPGFNPGGQNLHIHWDNDNSEVVVETVAVGVNPTKDSHLATKYYVDNAIATVSGGGIDHGVLAGLSDDDHPQYLTRTDFTTHSGAIVAQIPTDYYTQAQVDTLLDEKENTFIEIYGGSF